MNDNYILIQNDGEIEVGAFEMIGASTKRKDSTKIGYFGSGLKYSIAFMLRNNIEFHIYSGLRKIEFSVKPTTFRDQSFDCIVIDGKVSSFTTSMGPTWNKAWYILREIYCNALDEPKPVVVPATESLNPVEGKTRIYIRYNDELADIVKNWDKYFSTDRDPLWIAHDIDTCSFSSADMQYRSKEAGGYKQNVKIYNKTGGSIYRKGVQVYTLTSAAFDYGFDHISINEDRQASQFYGFGEAVAEIMAKIPSEAYVHRILSSRKSGTTLCYEYSTIRSNDPRPDDVNVEGWLAFSKKYALVVEELSGWYINVLKGEPNEVLFIPYVFASPLKKACDDIRIIGLDSIVNGESTEPIEMTKKIEYLLKDTIKVLGEMNYTVRFPVTVVKFANEKIKSLANKETKQIYLDSTLFDEGRRAIAQHIMTQNESVLSDQDLATPGFEDHIITKWIAMLEEQNGIFL